MTEYKAVLLEQLLANTFSQEKTEKINSLCLAHAVAENTLAWFLYNGKLYTHTDYTYTNNIKCKALNLNKKLHKDMQDLLEKDSYILDELDAILIKNYVTACVQFSSYTKDLLLLLPTVSNYLQDYQPEFSKPEVIAAFMQKHKNARNAFLHHITKTFLLEET